ncbi:MAG: DUF3408 domain-containing protein [Parabacteroides sp.]|nr:DUF3408 domain-containing protein [Parabacteroides sp.]
MTAENNFDKLRSKVHQGVPLEKTAGKTLQEKKGIKSANVIAETSSGMEAEAETAVAGKTIEPYKEIVVPVSKASELLARPPEKRKRKQQADYQDVFFNRIDFTHRKPLYITATTHRRLMRIVHLMDESKATISSYVENIILNHLETFKEDVDTIYRTNSINPTE